MSKSFCVLQWCTCFWPSYNNFSLASCFWSKIFDLKIELFCNTASTLVTDLLPVPLTESSQDNLTQRGPKLRAWRATLRFEEEFAGRKERNCIAIRRLVCYSSRPNVCCTPNAMLDSRIIFTLKFSVSLFGTQNRDFLLEKRYKTHQQNNKTNYCFLVLVIKSMSALILLVDKLKQAFRVHQPFSSMCRYWPISVIGVSSTVVNQWNFDFLLLDALP